MDLLGTDINSLQDFNKYLKIDSGFFGDMILILVILMLGIVSVQVIMVSVSSFVSNIEEAGNIQSPMYILFMGLYYFSLSMNQPAQLEKGLAKLCSFLPITSMLFMPYRIMLTKIAFGEIVLGILINSLFLVASIFGGRYLYGKGILYQKSNRK
jgi:ABC-2 type transport system permease protein